MMSCDPKNTDMDTHIFWPAYPGFQNIFFQKFLKLLLHFFQNFQHEFILDFRWNISIEFN